MRGELRAGRQERRRGPASAAQAEGARGRDCGWGGWGAHAEHAVHVCDAGRVEAERLVELAHVLPRAGSRAYAVRQAPGGGRRRATADWGHTRRGADSCAS